MDRPEPVPDMIEQALLEQATRLGVPVNGMSEVQLRLCLQKIDPAGADDRARRWAEDNADAIKDYNARIARRGLIGDHFRRW